MGASRKKTRQQASTSSSTTAELSRAKRIVFAAAPSVIVVVLAFVLGEIGLRLAYGRIERITGATEWSTATWEGFTYHWDQYHPRYGWTNRPGYRSDTSFPYTVTINNQGLRGNGDVAHRPAPGITRIAVFGDSCTFGEEVDDDETIPAYLEQYLTGTEVLNFGVHGWGLGQMVLRLEEEGFAYEPDHVVVVLLVPWDIPRDWKDRIAHSKPVFGVQDGQLIIGNTPVPVASQQPWLFRHCFCAAWLFGRPRELNEPPDALRERLRITQALVQRLMTDCRSRDVQLTLVTMLMYRDAMTLESKPNHRRVLDQIRAALNYRDLDLLDLRELLVEVTHRDGPRLEAAKGHWSDQGNCMIAERIAAHLAAKDDRITFVQGTPPCELASR
jgi:hypothetical protein